MSNRNRKVVVYWVKDKKVGIENLSCVPEGSRFVGAATPVQFHGDKKFYPAKIKLISGDQDEIDRTVERLEEEIERAAQKKEVPKKRQTKAASKDSSVATERDVALALGNRAPIPKSLQSKHKETVQTSKDGKANLVASQNQLDEKVLSAVRKSLFSATKQSSKGSKQSHASTVGDNDDDEEESSDDDDDDNGSGMDGEESDEDEDENGETVTHSDSNEKGSCSDKWCSCAACQVLKKYDSPLYLSFLRDIADLYDEREADDQKFLELLKIPDNEKQVELVSGKGVFIGSTVKDQLKVDHRNKPSALAKHTLFALYGKEPFQVLNITGRGKKKGSYTIPQNVLTAVCSFVNRNVAPNKQLKSNKLVALINKRAKEWKKSPSPKKRKGRKVSKGKVTSISPSSSPMASPVKSPSKLKGTPVKSPAKLRGTPVKSAPANQKGAPVKSPVKQKGTPLKSPTKPRSPLKHMSPAKSSGNFADSFQCGPYPPFAQQYQPSYSQPGYSSYPQQPYQNSAFHYQQYQQQPYEAEWGGWGNGPSTAELTTL